MESRLIKLKYIFKYVFLLYAKNRIKSIVISHLYHNPTTVRK